MQNDCSGCDVVSHVVSQTPSYLSFSKELEQSPKEAWRARCQSWYAFSLDIGHTATFNCTCKAVDTIYDTDTDISDAQVFIDMIHEWDQDGFVDGMKVSADQLRYLPLGSGKGASKMLADNIHLQPVGS